MLVTGASGFVGRAVCDQALKADVVVRRHMRSAVMPNIDGQTDWTHIVSGCSAVVHLAARVHVMGETTAESLAEFRRVNVQGTINLARQAATAGVRRFVFISSIGVNGAETFQQPFSARDNPSPHSPYAVSKYEAELGLQALATETGMDVVIIRPPLVYGPGAPGNFGFLERWLKRRVPLPLGAVHNRRSLVSLDNLVDLIMTCLTHPNAANQTFLVSDGEDVSTTELLYRMGRAIGCTPHLFPVPARMLRWAAAMVGKRDMGQRLCGSLQVDIEKTRRLLEWNPPFTLDEGLIKVAEGPSV